MITGRKIGLGLSCSRLYGEIPFNNSFSSLGYLDLSKNNLSGRIPENLANCNTLLVLDLRLNNFYGLIPQTFGNDSRLNILNPNGYQLDGPIPTSLVNCSYLRFLQVLNLSYNQLVGAIPRENHFDTLPKDSYIGNSGLRGFPLSKVCITDDTPESSSTAEDYSECENGFGWKAVLTGYVCGMVLGMLMPYVAISTGKPRLLAKIAEGVYGRKVGRQDYKRRNGRKF